MNSSNLELYNISSEYNLTEVLGHFDSDIVIDIMKDKITHKNYLSVPESNILISFEDNFKIMKERFPGDEENINIIRERVYREIIDILCSSHNLSYDIDEYTDLYTLAYLLYELLVCNFNAIMVNFFTSFIINNKDSIYNSMNLEAYKKNKDSSTLYNKKIFIDPKYITISANLETILKYIVTMDITLGNIIQSTYIKPDTVNFLNEKISDLGDFFRDFYCSTLNKVDILPILLTDIRMNIQRIVSTASIGEYIEDNKEGNK